MGAKRKAAGELNTSDMDVLKEIVKSSVEEIMETKLSDFCTNFKSDIRSFVRNLSSARNLKLSNSISLNIWKHAMPMKRKL